jgi:RNA polymerase sigma-70 factor (ECF subfamily)
MSLESNAGGASAVPAEAVLRPAGQRSIEAELPALRHRLLRHARFAVNDHGLAEDLVQDTLIVVVEQYTRHRGDASLGTWATAILKNKIADWYRSPTRRRMVQMSAEDTELEDTVDTLFLANGGYVDPVPAWQQPENREEQRQMMTILERCLGGLPHQTGRVFMMREWLGFETGEICERLGVSAENCRTILHRARTALRICMQHKWIDAKASP